MEDGFSFAAAALGFVLLAAAFLSLDFGAAGVSTLFFLAEVVGAFFAAGFAVLALAVLVGSFELAAALFAFAALDRAAFTATGFAAGFSFSLARELLGFAAAAGGAACCVAGLVAALAERPDFDFVFVVEPESAFVSI